MTEHGDTPAARLRERVVLRLKSAQSSRVRTQERRSGNMIDDKTANNSQPCLLSLTVILVDFTMQGNFSLTMRRRRNSRISLRISHVRGSALAHPKYPSSLRVSARSAALRPESRSLFFLLFIRHGSRRLTLRVTHFLRGRMFTRKDE